MESSDWENSKENVAPVKSGRSIKGLGGARGGLSNKPVLGKELGESGEEQRFERDIMDARSADESNNKAEEILNAYLAYYKYVKSTYASSHDKTRAVLERVTSELKDIPTMKNDEKYVKLWVELADMSRTPSETFGFMQANKIGEKVALFWIAWAFVAEKADKFDVTEKIFKKAIKHQAEPKKMVQSRFQQFQRRMVSRIRNGEIATPGEGKNDSSADASASGSREALTELSRSKTSRNSSLRTGEAVSSRPAGGLSRDENRRERIASNNSNRLADSSSSGGGSSIIRNTGSSRITATSRISSGASGARTGVADAAPAPARPTNNFMIFSDSNAVQDPHNQESHPQAYEATNSNHKRDEKGGSEWRELAPEAKRVKENHVPVSTWSEAPLGGGASATPVEAPAFSIFSDTAASATTFADPPVADVGPESGPGAVVADESANDMLENKEIPVEEEEKEEEEAQDQLAGLPAPGSAGMSAQDLANLSMMDEEDGTINTRLAMGTIDAMFCDSPLPPSKTSAQKEDSPPKAAMGFTIFSDDQV